MVAHAAPGMIGVYVRYKYRKEKREGFEATSMRRVAQALDTGPASLYVYVANRDELLRLARGDADRAKVRLLRSFDPAAPPDAEVPDPYYGGPSGFEEVFDLCEAACRGLLAHLRREHRL